jgi:hypothetical protein
MWLTADSNGRYGIRARGFTANGGERFPQMVVNTIARGDQSLPVAAMAA